MTRGERIAALKHIAKARILVLDGSWGVMFQRMGLEEADFRSERFATHPVALKGNNDILCLTRPDAVTELHEAYYGAGADISETNTFSATDIVMEDYKLSAADCRSMGPLNKMLSMSSDVNDPGARLVSFDQVYDAYKAQARALNEGGVDLYLIETITDTLNCKAAIKAILDLEAEGLEPLPIWISGTITDRSGRTLSGQTAEAFWNSVKHAKPFAIGFNCALGADLMRPFVAELSRPMPWGNMTKPRTRPAISCMTGQRTVLSILLGGVAGRHRIILPVLPPKSRVSHPVKSPYAPRP